MSWDANVAPLHTPNTMVRIVVSLYDVKDPETLTGQFMIKEALAVQSKGYEEWVGSLLSRVRAAINAQAS